MRAMYFPEPDGDYVDSLAAEESAQSSAAAQEPKGPCRGVLQRYARHCIQRDRVTICNAYWAEIKQEFGGLPPHERQCFEEYHRAEFRKELSAAKQRTIVAVTSPCTDIVARDQPAVVCDTLAVHET